MHLYNHENNAPPQGRGIYVMCNSPVYPSGIENDQLGNLFVELYVHDIVITIVGCYLNMRYSGNRDLNNIYTEFLDNTPQCIFDETDWIITSIFDEAETATDNHPTIHENILEYFNHDAGKIGVTIFEMIETIHQYIFFPVMNAIEMCYSSGLTLCPFNCEMRLGGLMVGLDIMEDEYGYYQFDPEGYIDAPFRRGVPRVQTAGEIGRVNYRYTNRAIYPMVY